MSDSPQPTLLDEIDQRQDEILQQLDELNERIEQLLRDCTEQRGEDVEQPVTSAAA